MSIIFYIIFWYSIFFCLQEWIKSHIISILKQINKSNCSLVEGLMCPLVIKGTLCFLWTSKNTFIHFGNKGPNKVQQVRLIFFQPIYLIFSSIHCLSFTLSSSDRYFHPLVHLASATSCLTASSDAPNPSPLLVQYNRFPLAHCTGKFTTDTEQHSSTTRWIPLKPKPTGAWTQCATSWIEYRTRLCLRHLSPRG